MTDVVVAIDAGGTKLLGGLVHADGAVLATEEVATPRTPEGCDPGLRALAGLAGRLASSAAAGGHRVTGVGLGFPEYVRDGKVTSAEVFAWDRQPAEVLADVVPDVAGGGRGRRPLLRGCRGVGPVGGSRHEPVLRVVGHRLSSALVLDGLPLRAAAARRWHSASGRSRLGRRPGLVGEPRAVRRGLLAGPRYTRADAASTRRADGRRLSGRRRPRRRRGRRHGCPGAGPCPGAGGAPARPRGRSCSAAGSARRTR